MISNVGIDQLIFGDTFYIILDTRVLKQALKYKPKWGRNKTMPKEKM